METTEPLDLYLNQIIATVFLYTSFLFPNSIIRKLLGIPYLLFLPGYNLTAVFFPWNAPHEKDNHNDSPEANVERDNYGIGWIERLSLSFGLSLIVVILIGLGLNYTPWGIRLIPVLVVNYLFISLTTLLAFFRRSKLPEGEKLLFRVDYNLNKKVTLSLVISIIVITASISFLFMTPRQGEKYTEFYLLDPEGNMENYPTNLTVGEQGRVIIGIENHEYTEVPYRIEIWPINKSIKALTSMKLVWFYEVTLDHWGKLNTKAQWERTYTFSFIQNGTYKVMFLLFRLDVQNPLLFEEGRVITGIKAESHLNSSYRILHLWVQVDR